MNTRYDELDSLRGLAATSVVLSHYLGVVPIFFVILLSKTPFHVVWAGHEAVILFFLLSGFVLSLPYYNNKVSGYKNYLIRRICRIYIPYITSIILALLCLILIPRINAPELNGWFHGAQTPITTNLVLNHFFLLGYFQSASYNFVIWSLVHEMRISILFPIIMYFVSRFHWRKNILIGMVISIFCLVSWYAGLKLFKYDIMKFDTSYILTLHYLSFFMIGALLAKYRLFIHNYYKKLSISLKVIILTIAILAYTYSWWFFHDVFFLHFQLVDDWIIALGGSIFIIFSLNSNKVRSILLSKPIHFVGKISYSLYLFHVIVELSLVNALYGKLPIGVILMLAFLTSLIVATITYYFVEIPAIKLGRKLTKNKNIMGSESIQPKVSIT
jgi:peptidoglycan/LPS O-acetylase OafA/YrhL